LTGLSRGSHDEVHLFPACWKAKGENEELFLPLEKGGKEGFEKELLKEIFNYKEQ